MSPPTRTTGIIESPSPPLGRGVGVRGCPLQNFAPHPRPLAPEGRGEKLIYAQASSAPSGRKITTLCNSSSKACSAEVAW